MNALSIALVAMFLGAAGWIVVDTLRLHADAAQIALLNTQARTAKADQTGEEPLWTNARAGFLLPVVPIPFDRFSIVPPELEQRLLASERIYAITRFVASICAYIIDTPCDSLQSISERIAGIDFQSKELWGARAHNLSGWRVGVLRVLKDAPSASNRILASCFLQFCLPVFFPQFWPWPG